MFPGDDVHVHGAQACSWAVMCMLAGHAWGSSRLGDDVHAGRAWSSSLLLGDDVHAGRAWSSSLLLGDDVLAA